MRIRPKSSRVPAVVALSMVVVIIAASASSAGAAGIASITSFLLKPGEQTGFAPATPRIFHTAPALVESFEKGKPAERDVAHFEAEGFVEAATAHMQSQSEPKAEGVSTVIVFETSAGAKADLKRELKLDLAPSQVGKHIVVTRFKVPGVPEASAYELSGFGRKDEEAVANVLFVEGSCLLIVGDYEPRGKEAAKPVIAGTRALHRRIAGRCPQ